MFLKVRHFLPISTLVCIYNPLFSPFLQYGILGWELTYETHIKPVFLLQKQLLRAISVQHYTSSTSIFSDLKILKLHDLFQLKLLGFMYDCINKTASPYFHWWNLFLLSVLIIVLIINKTAPLIFIGGICFFSYLHWWNLFINMVLGKLPKLTFL